ncbi:hypothetical protein B9Z19DRAFT_1082974 [Tuber borchii]|uniref:Uncharacterized protein n=1 Tax=Tuber borchii TaxID=42251 RepID=A0A2T6ZTT8_TUBBO|nr:hypothetical protein B9Z19DRAFT_1082974 [Tuber borchii]
MKTNQTNHHHNQAYTHEDQDSPLPTNHSQHFPLARTVRDFQSGHNRNPPINLSYHRSRAKPSNTNFRLTCAKILYFVSRLPKLIVSWGGTSTGLSLLERV